MQGSSTPPQEAWPKPRTASFDVLIVDDDVDIRETVEEILASEGFEVATARNGAEALEKLREGLPRLILLDLFMPVMDGAEFRQQQMQDPEVAPIPVVVVSAAAGLEERIARLDVADHLEKPLDIEHLFDVVGRYCR